MEYYLSKDPELCVKPSLRGKKCTVIRDEIPGVSCIVECCGEQYAAFNSQVVSDPENIE